MRCTTASFLFLALSLAAVTNALRSRQTRDADDSSEELSESSNAIDLSPHVSQLRNEFGNDVALVVPEPRLFGNLCVILYQAITSVIPATVVNIITALLLLPPGIILVLLSPFIPGISIGIINGVRDCMTSGGSGSSRIAYGDDPLTGIARFEGAYQGDVVFAQRLAREDTAKAVTVVTKIKSLTPNAHYNLKIHQSGDTLENCANVGAEFLSVGASSFVADGEGTAVLLLQESSLSLEGPQSIMGRALVLTPLEGGPPVCAVIARSALQDVVF